VRTCPSNLDVSKAIGLYAGIEWGLKVKSFAPYSFTAETKDGESKFSVFVCSAEGSKIRVDEFIRNSLSNYIILVIHNKPNDNAIVIKNDSEFKSIISSDNTIDGKELVSIIKRKFEAQIDNYDG
jgi:hypothetical protein